MWDKIKIAYTRITYKYNPGEIVFQENILEFLLFSLK